ncbi:HD-GYP domain-containing protein [Bacteriovorax sp. DB6_IX]|uniref:HD-GYP domain-containing protein n=1 Tax=Bacteriovorax sp. DB6_IX TaxID=1353530 RepID=UPI0006A6BB17|nr:HD domain-containing phosphohydrolase [Bacteriovorax sp. DB6_IX]
MIGKELDLAFEDMNNLKLSAVLHDIGKIGIEDNILKKKAPLTADEFLVMKEHPRLGYEILGHIESLSEVVDGMRFHHERPDGKGYPFGLKGDEIPVIAMIISVADTFDAMISNRPYRKGLPPMIAWQEILDNRGTQFSEKVVDAFDRAFKKTKMYRPEKMEKIKKAG